MENQAIQQVEANDDVGTTTPTPQVQPHDMPGVAGIANTDLQPVTAVADSLPIPSMTKHEQRYQLANKFAVTRCEIESQVSAAVNAKCGQRYKGTFEVRFDNPNEVTTKTLSTFCNNGAVFFTADDLEQHPTLKNIRKAEEGINLSALMSRVKRPTNIDDNSWQELEQMWNNVSKTLYSQGIAPMHIRISGVLTANGLGGPKINKKLGGSIDVNSGSQLDVMCKVLDELNESLVQHTSIN
ncbi:MULTISPECIES: hypothetical protein [unclassified Janthinobacterium]|uniref:hypothetical protein n=1 Tax=unclassified Janthinobacterium TaxID=2610881 RepID=UPI001622D14F|nr:MULTISPECIES: hypothetical protein [unclassified Janthinobacterium]MBB5371077.1 hypothetical protein [Janthinobacterium sp. K2C7]MBB5383883.1 hypothetical protein [Janthinobacterium sp. K2Li3]MBB5389295.1 hypothetical protein [Janthinobacterium sp. K2E3]